MGQGRARLLLAWLCGGAALAWAAGFAATPDWPAHLRLFQLTDFALAVLVTAGALRGREGRGRAWLIFFWATAAAARALLVLHPPPLSSDIYRYVWDARVWRHGINPFRHPPVDPSLAFLRDAAVYPRINYPEIPTIYPLFDQLLFLAASVLVPGALGLKALLAAAELGLLALVRRELHRRGRPLSWSWLVAWHPLLLTETAANGHADAWGALLLFAGLTWVARKPLRGAALLALAALCKWTALVALPALRLTRRQWLLAAALVLAGAAAFVGPGVPAFYALGQYLGRWRWNDALFWVVMQETQGLGRAKLVVAAILLAWVLLVSRRERDPVLAARSALGALFLLAPAVHPWYAVWILPLVALAPDPGWLWLLAALPLAYGPWPDRLAVSQAELGPGLKALEFGPAFAWWLGAFALRFARKKRTGPDRSGPAQDSTAREADVAGATTAPRSP